MTTPEGAPAAPEAAPPAPPRKSRVRKILLISALSLIGLVLGILIVGPFIIASIVKSRIREEIASKLQAEGTVATASFSWGGRLRLGGLRIVPKGFQEPLLEVATVDVKIDVPAAIGGRYLAAVQIVDPKVFVEKGADGKFNYEFPRPAPAPSSGAAAAGSDPFVQTTLGISGGELRIRGKGVETRYRNLKLDAVVDTLEKPIAYGLSLQGPDDGRFQVKGSFDVKTRSGPATLLLERVSLKNLSGAARAYSDVVSLDGTLSGTLDYELRGAPRFAGKGRLEVSDLSVAMPGRRFTLSSLTVAHDGGIDEKGNGRQVLTLSCGKALGGTITMDVTDAFGSRTVGTDLKLDADLASLAPFLRAAEALPTRLQMAGVVSLRGTCQSKGPSAADLEAGRMRVAGWVDVRVVAAGLDLDVAGKPMKLDRISLRHRGTLDEAGNGKNVIDLESGKALNATIEADLRQWREGKATVRADSDLGELGKLLEKLLGLKPDIALEGAATLLGSVEAKGAELAKADLTLVASNLAAIDAREKKRYELDPKILTRIAGSWDGRTKTATADLIHLESSFATLDGKGGASMAAAAPALQESSLRLDVDLGKLSTKLKSFLEKPPALDGRASLEATATGEKIDARATLRGLKAGAYGPVDASLVQSGTYSTAKGGGLKILAGTATCGGADLKIRGEIRDLLEATRSGELKLEALLRPVELSKWIPDLKASGPEFRVESTIGFQPKGIVVETTAPAFAWTQAGTTFKGNLESRVTWSETETTGTTTLRDAELVDEKKNVVKDPRVSIVHEIGFQKSRTALELRKFEVSSSFLRGSVVGRITGLDREPEFQGLRASFQYLPVKLGAVLKPWLPGSLEGTDEKALTLTLDGKAASFDALSLLRGARGSVDLDVAKFTTENGLSLSGKARYELQDARLTSTTPLQVNQGNVGLNASLDFRDAATRPQSVITFTAKDVDANANMGPILEQFNPIFHTVNGTLEGQVQSGFTLLWTGVLDPAEKDWGAAASRALSGGGTFAAKNLVITGSPAVAQIMELMGEGNSLRGEIVGTDIQVASGKLSYKDMTLRLAKYELRFTGWVGFDKKMELMVEMPMTEGMLKRWPNLQKYIGKTIFVPLKGRTDSPRLDVAKAVAELAERAAIEALTEKLLKKKDKDKK